MYEAEFPVPEGSPAAAQTEDTGDASRFMAGSLPLDGAGPMGIIYDREQELYAAVPALDDNGPISTERQTANYMSGKKAYAFFDSEEDARAWRTQHTTPEAVSAARRQLRSQMLLARGITPEQIARDKAVASRLGISFDLYRYNRDELDDEDAARTIERYDGLTGYAATSPLAAAYVRSDHAALASVEELIRTRGLDGEIREFREPGLMHSYDLGTKQAELARLGNAYAAGTATVEDIDKVKAQIAGLSRMPSTKLFMEKPERGSDLIAEAGNWLADTFSFSKFMEQVPTSVGAQAASAAEGLGMTLSLAAAGAKAGAAAGTVAAPGLGTGVGAAIGGITAGTAGLATYMVRSGQRTYELERGSQIASMLEEKDADGNPLPKDVVVAAASLYAAISTGVELGSDAVFAKVLGPLAGKLAGSAGAKQTAHAAIMRAARDKNLQGALIDAGRRMGALTATEGSEEAIQESAAILTEQAAKAYANASRGQNFNMTLDPSKTRERISDAFWGGAAGGFWMGGGPVIAMSALNIEAAHAARKFADRQVAIHERVMQTQMRSLDAGATMSALEHMGPEMSENMVIPLDAAVALHQEGTDILTPLGLSLETAQDGAAKGMSITVPLSAMHATLDSRQFRSAAEIMHRGDEAASASDAGFSAQDFGEALAQAASDMDAMAAEREGVAHLSKEQISDLDAAQGEMRDQLVAAIGSQPNLKAQAEASGGVQQYAGALLETWRRWALQMSRRTGENPADIYRRISFSGGQQIDQSTPVKGTTGVQGVTSGTRLSGERPAQAKGLTNPGSISSMDRGMGSVLRQAVAPDNRLKADSALWRTRVDTLTSKPSRAVLMLPQSPIVMTLVGSDIHELYADNHLFDGIFPGHAKKGHHEHPEISRKILKQLPEAIADPIAIFKSYDPRTGQHRKGTYVFIVNLYDKNGNTVTIPVRVNKRGEGSAVIDLVKTAFGSKSKDGTPNGQFAELLRSNKKDLCYVNTSLLSRWVERNSPLLGGSYVSTLADELNISTEQDLRKLKDENPTMYQGGDAGRIINGQVRFNEGEGNYVVELFKTANLSTLAHEMGHIYFLEMQRAVENGFADESMQKDYGKLCAYVGAKPGVRWTVDQNEKLARAWETYLREGRAPSSVLEEAFARFRQWLTKIYRELSMLNVELNDEVRSVFDRMLATDAEIEEATIQHGIVDLTTGELDALGVAKPQQEVTRKVIQTAKAIAAQRLQEKREYERTQRLADYRRQAAKEVDALPSSQAKAAMRKTPLNKDALTAAVGEEATQELMARGVGLVSEKGEADPTILAARHGYASAEDMVSDIISSRTKKEAVEEIAQAMEAKYEAQYQAIDEVVATEGVHAHLAAVGSALARVAGRAYVQQQAIAAIAAETLAGMNMFDAMRSASFRANMRNALRSERRAIASGDYNAAIEANTRARIQLELARQSHDLSETRDRLERQVKRFYGSKSAPERSKAFLFALASRHDFGPTLAAAEKYSIKDLNEWQEELKKNGFELLLDPEVMSTDTPWTAMTAVQFSELADAIRQIIMVERNQRKLLTSDRKESLKEMCEQLAASITAHGRPQFQKTVEEESRIVSTLKRIHASHTKIEELCLQMDGGKQGLAWELIYRPIAQADSAQALKLREVRKYLKDNIFGMYTAKELSVMGLKKKLVPSIGESLTKENRIAVALNLGNQTNKERIMTGHKWSEAQIADIVSELDARDWKFVEAVWKYFETFRPESFRVQEEITGVRPRAVEATPFQVTTADGKPLTLSGGYYPIRYNSSKSFKQFARDQKEMDQELFGGRNYGTAQTKHGHLKERQAGGNESPLLLELSVIPDHLYNTVHDISFRKAIIDVARVIRSEDVRSAIENFAGKEYYRQLMPWLQDCAQERQDPMSQLNALARWARSAGSIMTMGFKATTILTQPVGITQTIDVIGAKWTMAGLLKVFGNPFRLGELWEETVGRSAFMATRVESYDREIRDMAKSLQVGTVRNWVNILKQKAFVPMGIVQLGVDLPTWWGAYEKGLTDYSGDTVRAAEYADSCVRQAQGSGSTKDLAAIQRGSDLQKLFTMYYSYFNTLYNLGARHIRELRDDFSPSGIFRAANSALLLWFIPCVLSEIIAGRGPDDDEDWRIWAARTELAYPFQSIMGVRDVVNGIASAYGYQMSPASAAPESIVAFGRSIIKALEHDEPAAMVKPALKATGYLFSLPIGQPLITCGNMWDYITNPRSEFYVRDLFFVKPESRKKREKSY